MAYNPVGVDQNNALPTAVVTPAANTVLKASSAALIRGAIDAAPTVHTHPTTAIVDLTEYIQDTVAGLLKAGTNVTTSYDDAANTFTINASVGGGGGTTDPEVVRDTIGGALNAGSGVSITVDDAGDSITIAVAGIPQSAVSGLGASLAALAPLASPTFTGTVTAPALKVTGGTVAAGRVLTSDANGNATWQPGTPGPAGPSGGLGMINVKAYGAVGDASTNDTTAIANAWQACLDAAIEGHPKALYFPSGWYRVTSLPNFANYATIVGDGQRATTILYEGTGTLCTLTNRQEVSFHGIGVWATGAGSTILDLSACFSVYLDDVLFRGVHTSGSGATYRTQVGLNIRDNTGNTQFRHFNFNNLGIGLRTRTIQNHGAQGKFAYCYQSILLTGNNANAGLNLVEVEFDSAKDATTTIAHLTVDGSANEISLVACWFEGGNVACSIGVAGTGGPSSFKVFGGKMAGRATYLQINHCAKTLLAGVEFNPDQQTPTNPYPAELSINATYAPRGMAQMLMTTTPGRSNEDIPRSFFPNSWTVIDSAGIRATVVAP